VAGIPVLATSNCGYAFHVEKARAGKVIAGHPFRQEEMNEGLLALLTSPDYDQVKKNALSYADEADLYSRPRRAVEIMEALGKQLRRKDES
jgi:UDP-glucose:(heptosyl)LPS alpha-1,3-glucosyltransferase